MPDGELRRELGTDPPPWLVSLLDSGQQTALAAAVRGAKSRQCEGLDRAAYDALSHLPGLVRKAAERMLR